MSILSKTIEPSHAIITEKPLKPNIEISIFLNGVIQCCLHALVFLVPLIFTPWTIDILELSKQTLLVILVSVAVIAWAGKVVAEKQFTIIRHWVHLMVLLFGIGYLVISFFSQDRYLSFVGAFGQMPWSFATILSLVLLYFVVVHHVRKTSQVYNFILTFLLSSFIAACYGALQIFGWNIFDFTVAQSRGFSSVGTMYSLAVYLVVPVIVSVSLLFHGCRNKVCYLGSPKPIGIASRVLLWAMLVIGLFDLILIDFWGAWLGLIFGIVLTIGIGFLRSRRLQKPISMIAPLVVLLLSVLFIFAKSPINTKIPNEISPSFSASWEIASKTLEQYPLTGSGPGTWIYDYALFRVQDINLSPFWQIRFDRGFSYFLTLIATTGLIGAILWFTLVISGIVKSTHCLLKERDDDIWYAYLTVFTGWLTLVFLSFIYNLNMPHVVLMWVLFALLGAVVSRQTMSWDAKRNPVTFGILSTVFVIVVVSGISVSWLSGQRYASEYLFSKAVTAHKANEPIGTYLPLVDRASKLNPRSDVYARNLSQAYLLKAIQSIKDDPTRAESIQRELKESIDEAQHAVALASKNVDNWSNLGLIYENISSFVPGADEQAISAFLEAHNLEPQNPIILTEIGKLYLLRSDAYRTSVEKPEKDQNQVQRNIKENLVLAEQRLREAVSAKPDYLPSRYYLGVVYERGGNIQQAIKELENVLQINNNDIGVAFELSILYYRNNQKAEALNLMEQIVNISPENSNALWYLSAMYNETGETEAAIRMLEALQKQFPEHEAVKQKLQTLRLPKIGAPTKDELPLPIEKDISGPKEQNPIN